MENYFYMTIEKNNVVVKYDSSSKKKITKQLRNFTDYLNFFNNILMKRAVKAEDLTIMCSSSLDFPHEYTKKKSVIALANRLRKY